MLTTVANDSETPSGFMARVDGASLPDLIQMNCLGGTRAVFRVSSSDGDEGYLYFDRGRVIHAEFNGASGEQAIHGMFALETGYFEPSQRAWPVAASIRSSWQSLVMRAIQERDETRSGVSRLPPPTRLPPMPPAPPTARSLGAETNSVPPGAASNGQVAVRITKTGEVLSSRGEARALTEAAAFVFGVSQLVGDTLGLGELRSIEVEHPPKSTLIYQDQDGDLIGVSAPSAELSALRKQVGLV